MVRKAEARIFMPIYDVANATHIGMAAVLGDHLLSIRFVQFDACDDCVGKAASL